MLLGLILITDRTFLSLALILFEQDAAGNKSDHQQLGLEPATRETGADPGRKEAMKLRCLIELSQGKVRIEMSLKVFLALVLLLQSGSGAPLRAVQKFLNMGLEPHQDSRQHGKPRVEAPLDLVPEGRGSMENPTYLSGRGEP